MLEDLEMEYFKIFNEFPNIFNWVDVTEEDKIKILKKCIDEKIEVDDCDLYIMYLSSSKSIDNFSFC